MSTRSAPPRHRTLALSCLLAAALATAAAAQWPQWRGIDGAGIATTPEPLPVEWSADAANVRWRTEIPGEGTSSPVVSDGRVFVTTAYEGDRFTGLRAGVAVAVALLAALFAVGAWRRRRPVAEPRPGSRAALVFSLIFAALAILIAVQPELFYSVDNPGRVWRTCGAVGLLGLGVGFAWLRPGSALRLGGAAILLAASAFFVLQMPHGPRGPIPLDKRLTFAAPGLAAAAICLVNWLRARRRDDATAVAPGLTLLALLLAPMIFLPPNYLGGLLRVVVCLDFDSGEILWTRPVLAAPPEQKWPRSSYATPTPATDGEVVAAYFGAGVGVLGLDGDLLWARRFPEYSRHTRYGAGSSPLIVGDAVIVVQESEMYQDGPPSWMAAFDKATGDVLWRITPEGAQDSYGTPLVFDTPGGPQMVHASWKALTAWDLATGAPLWRVDYPMWQLVASMGRSGDTVAVTGGAYGEKTLMALRLPEDRSGPPELLWTADKRVASIASPVIYQGLLFTVTDGGIMSCYDAETGEEQWKQRLDGEFYASLVAGDGKVYALATDGSTRVIAASREFALLADNELASPSGTTSPALGGGSILIRTEAGLYRIDAKG
ncbi:MAG: PQQ-binding-like beta-propeller repeat protein [Thermoanaerobaculia bacterium]|nr:PQQ-binding-like beta-propeller repeat protein [Thermoanaerobaculia bacterium]